MPSARRCPNRLEGNTPRSKVVEHSTLFPRTGLRDLGENHVLNSFDFGDVEMIDHPGVEFNLGRAQVDVLNQSPPSKGLRDC